MIGHPAADAARDACISLRYEEAVRILDHALVAEPNDPDLISERAFLHLLQNREDLAFSMLDAAQGGLRAKRLSDALHAFFACRVQLDPDDAAAKAALRKFRGPAPAGVGVRLTASLIVKNEAKNLPRCLASLQGMVDEIVVVDTGSTDDSVAIAKEFGAIVSHYEWNDDFAAARNASLDLATGDWILWIDADEVLDPTSKSALRQAVVRPHFGGYNLEIVNLMEDREDGGTLLHYPTRIFRHLPEIRFTGSIHEQVQPSLTALGLPWATLGGIRLIHYGYRPSVMADGSKLARTVRMLEKTVAENPADGFQWYNLANAHFTAGNAIQAELSALEALRNIPINGAWRDLCYQCLAASRIRLRRPQEALATCREAEAEGHTGILIAFERAQAEFNSGKLQDARETCDRLVNLPWPAGTTGDYTIVTKKRHALRAQVLLALNEPGAALRAIAPALEADPQFLVGRLTRAIALESLGRLREAADDYLAASHEPQCRAVAQKGLGRVRLALGDPSAYGVLRAAYSANPEDEELWALWAQACAAAGETRELVTIFGECGANAVPSVNGLIEWGRALRAAAQAEAAIACFTEAIRRDPTCANAFFNAGDLLYDLGAYADAAHVYEAGLRHRPKYADAWFALGNCLAQMNLDAGARIAYDEALKLSPQHVGARHNRELIAA